MFNNICCFDKLPLDSLFLLQESSGNWEVKPASVSAASPARGEGAAPPPPLTVHWALTVYTKADVHLDLPVGFG